MENSSRNFSEIFIFWVVTQAVLLKNSSIKIMSTYSVFFNSGASHRPFYWKTHPFQFCIVAQIYSIRNFFLRKEIRPSRERLDYRSSILRVDRVFCANSLKRSAAPLKIRNRSFPRSKCKSCHDIDPHKDSRTSKYCDRCNSATCSNHAKI